MYSIRNYHRRYYNFDVYLILSILYTSAMSDRGEPDHENGKNADVYGTFQGSDDEDDALLLSLDKMQQSKKEGDIDLGPGFYQSPYTENDRVFDVFRTDGNQNTKVQKTQSVKKQIPLEEALVVVEQKLAQNTTIQNKISGFKLIAEKIKESKSIHFQIQKLCNWLEAMKIIDNFFHEDSHPQILRNMPVILRFLYENGKMHSEQLSLYALVALKAQQQYVKVVQSLLGFVRVEDLCTIFQLICAQSDLQNHNLASLLSNIVSNKYFFEETLVENEKKLKPSQENNLLSEDLQIEGPTQIRICQEETQVKPPIDESSREATKILTINLFKFLIQATDTHMNIFYPTLNKLITSKHVFLSSQLASTLPELLKNNKTNAIWVLEQCLKVDFGQSNKLKGYKNQSRFNFIQKLVNEHLYEYLLIMLSRTRFNKSVVDKILNIFILLSKNYKPLEDVYTQYIWKILGLNSREQKEREQFFNFVKDILRNQSNFTQESVYFIFFEVLMNLKAEWFSLKILDCLEMLFMRLNQDLKLISYADQTYQIQNPDLVGIDKFWYIYFHSIDPKVTKKCKDFLWKLATYINNNQIKRALLQDYNTKIISFMCESSEVQRSDFCCKGFQIIDKLLEQVQKKDSSVQMVQLVIQNQCRDAVAPKKIDLKFAQKSRLEHLREQISLAITPSTTNIRLICKGSILKGEKMTLKDLNLQNGNTIMVTDDEPAARPNDQQKLNIQNTVNQITEIFSDLSPNLVKFIVEKMEGHQLQRIMEAIMNEEKLAIMTSQFQELAQREVPEQKVDNNQPMVNEMNMESLQVGQQIQPDSKLESMDIESESQQPQPVKFSVVFSSNPENIKHILWCASQSNNKKGWQTVKSLPNSAFHLQQIRKHIEQKNWQVLFPKQQPNDMACAYNAHLLKFILQKNKNRIKKYMMNFEGFGYLVNWLMRLPPTCSTIVVEEVTSLLVIVLEEQAGVLGLFSTRVTKKEQKKLLGLMIEENLWICKEGPNELSVYGDQSFIKWLINLLLIHEKDSSLACKNISLILIYFLLTNNDRLLQVLQLPLSQMFHIIETHGFIGQYIFLCALSKTFIIDDPTLRTKYCNKLLELVDFTFDNKSQSTYKSNSIYIYDIVTCILDKSSHHKEKEKEIIIKCIKTISNFIEGMEVQELVSILLLLKSSLSKLYGASNSLVNDGIGYGPAQEEFPDQFMDYMVDQNIVQVQKQLPKQQNKEQDSDMLDQNQKQQLETPIFQFAEWLFKNYLFDLQKPTKHTRDKSIRKQCYQILGIIGCNCARISQMLVQSILKIEITERNRDDDYIDFRAKQYIGLTNLGATCYINSLLQQIYHTKFSKLLLQKGDNPINLAQQLRIGELKTIFMQLCYSIKNVANPKKFIKSLTFYGEPINTSVQQDATQFLLCLFDFIEGQGCQQEVYDVFGGFLCNEITVEDGGAEQQFVKNNLEHFNSLTIDIKGKKNLQEALAYLIKPQNLDGQNKYYCEELGKKMKANRRCFIQKMPNILILTLKRFQFDFDSQSRHKLNDYFQFPFDLDMHKYSAAWLRNKEETSESKYKLTGILVHSGSAESGHYYSYIKIAQQWYEFNDKMVSEFNVMNNLKNQCFGCSEGKKTRSAYMLFYEKAYTSYHGVYLNEIAESNLYKRKIYEDNAVFLKTRLIYDENFKKMLEKLNNVTHDKKLEAFINSLFSKKTSQQSYKKKQNKGQQMIYYDADDQIAPLINNGDEDIMDLLERD